MSRGSVARDEAGEVSRACVRCGLVNIDILFSEQRKSTEGL